MCGGRNTRSGCSVSGGNDLLRVEEVDSEETDRVEGDENKGEYDSNVGRDEIVFGDLGTANREAELEVSLCFRAHPSSFVPPLPRRTYHACAHSTRGNHQKLPPTRSLDEEEWDSATDQFKGQVGSAQDL